MYVMHKKFIESITSDLFYCADLHWDKKLCLNFIEPQRNIRNTWLRWNKKGYIDSWIVYKTISARHKVDDKLSDLSDMNQVFL